MLHCNLQNSWRDGIFWRMHIRTPSPLLLLSNLNEAMDSSILIWTKRKESSSFISENKTVSMSLPIAFSKNQIYFIINWYLNNPKLTSQVKGFSFPLSSPISASIILLQEPYSQELLKCFPESLKILQSYRAVSSFAFVLWYTSEPTK